MHIRNALWRGAILLSALLLVLPLWLGSNRVDPLFVLPLLGWISLGFVNRRSGEGWSIGRMVRLTGIAALLAGFAAWVASGTLPITQLAILALFALPLGTLHQKIGGGRSRLRRVALHVVLVIVWIPVGMAITEISYRWPAPDLRPRVSLLSSMPLAWGAGTDNFSSILSGETAVAPVYTLLRDTTVLQPVDMIMPSQLQSSDVLLLIQPRALPADALVAIDAWVRQGGRVLWLADPDLAFADDFALGDPRNPEPTEANLALLSRWGLQLTIAGRTEPSGSVDYDRHLPLSLSAPGRPSGRFIAIGRECRLRARAQIADCRIGEGRAVIVADADMVRWPSWLLAEESQGDSPVTWTSGNGQWLMGTLRQLADLPAASYLAQPVWLHPSFR